MRTLNLFLLFVLIFFPTSTIVSQVGIGTTNPDASSALDVSANDKGMLVPRMLVSERIGIASPAEGLLVYQTDDIAGFYYYNGSQWERLLDRGRDAIPTGAIFSFPIDTPPTGYLVCDGSEVSRTTYSDLFALIGTMYGNGDGSTTFNLPDFRGQFLRGLDDGAGEDPDAATRTDRGDGTIGDAVGTKQNFTNEQHAHLVDPDPVTTTLSGDHNHYIASRYVSSTSGGNHRHQIAARSLSTGSESTNHRHYLGYQNITIPRGDGSSGYQTIREVYYPNTNQYYTSTNSNSHVHSLYLPSAYTDYFGNHNHSVNVGNYNTELSGNHQHVLDINQFSSENSGGTESRPKNVSVLWCIKY